MLSRACRFRKYSDGIEANALLRAQYGTAQLCDSVLNEALMSVERKDEENSGLPLF